MARVGTGTVSISDLNSVYGFGYSLGSYSRSSTSVKNNTVALAPVGTTVSMDRLKGSYASGTYRNLNVYASSTTAGINVYPRNFNQAYIAGLSNNSDPANSYTVLYTQSTGNQGYATTSNVYRQYYYTYSDESQANGMYFRVSNVMFPYAGPFEEQGAWVVAVGLNYWAAYIPTYTTPVSMWESYGGGNFYNAYWNPSFADVFNGNNFLACYVSSGTLYFGMLNRAQLRAGVIQPVYAVAMAGVDSIWWYNTIMNINSRVSFITQSTQNLDLYMGWDEYIVRGYDLPPENNLYGQGDTCIRSKAVNPGSVQYVNGRVFE